MKFKPINGLVAIRTIKSDTTKGGIVLPNQTVVEHAKRGKIAAIAEGAYQSGVFIKIVGLEVGDIVAFNPHDAVELEIEEQKVLLTHYSNVLGVL